MLTNETKKYYSLSPYPMFLIMFSVAFPWHVASYRQLSCYHFGQELLQLAVRSIHMDLAKQL